MFSELIDRRMMSGNGDEYHIALLIANRFFIRCDFPLIFDLENVERFFFFFFFLYPQVISVPRSWLHSCYDANAQTVTIFNGLKVLLWILIALTAQGYTSISVCGLQSLIIISLCVFGISFLFSSDFLVQALGLFVFRVLFVFFFLLFGSIDFESEKCDVEKNAKHFMSVHVLSKFFHVAIILRENLIYCVTVKVILMRHSLSKCALVIQFLFFFCCLLSSSLM